MRIAAALPIKKGKLLATGGGAYNDFLMERVGFHLPEMQIIVPGRNILEYKEALIFGLLGVLKLRNEVNVLASVTGAKEDHSAGTVWEMS
jgi:anhydro-N-acetylmuramic acid kinase